MRDGVFVVTFFSGVILAVFLFGYSFIAVAEQLRLPGSLAEIEQLRRDSQTVGALQSEDVLGQVTQWNQKIASYQAYNRTWYANLLVPDAWDDVQPITMR